MVGRAGRYDGRGWQSACRRSPSKVGLSSYAGGSSLVNDVVKVIIAAKDVVFDELFRASARIVKLKGAQAEAKYARRDDSFAQLFVALADHLFGPSFIEKHLGIGWDWWPDHTRHLEASIDSFSQAFFDILRGLLVRQYKNWRIQVVVYGDAHDGQTMVGSIAIWADKLLIDRSLYALLKWRGIDLRCASEPVWRE